MSRCLLLLTALCLAAPIVAQKAKRVKAEYKYISDNRDESIRQAEANAFFKARCKALSDEFGATVGAQTDIETVSENGQASVRFRQRGGTALRADWLKTEREEVRSRSMTDDGFMVITVYVEGMAREISTAGVDFEYHLLRNGTTQANEDDRFRNRDLLTMMFQSPADGYLAVYLTDGERAYCMLPYKEQKDGIYRVRANRRYVFFSDSHALPEEQGYDLRLRLVTDKASEENTVYVVFSQQPFTKKADTDGSPIADNLVMPRNVSLDDFEDWLYQCQRKDAGMRVEKKTITITE